MMQNVYDYYTFTKDETYLKEKIYPMPGETRQVLEFLLITTRPVTVGFLFSILLPEHGTITIEIPP